jgi:Xaa-Pro aminopeptidase
VDNTRAGKSEMDLWRAFSASVGSNGALFENAFMSPTGTRSGGMAAPSEEKKLKVGDVGWFDFGCSYLGYHSDTGESFSLGQPTERQTKIYNALEDVVDRSIELAAPGMSSSDLCDEVVKIWDKHGVPRPPTGMGHGIGLETHEYPLIASQGSIFIPKDSRIKDDVVDNSTNFPFEEGMVLNFEAPYMVQGWGGVHIEKTVVVEKNGARLIAPQERHLRVIS